MQPSHTDSHDHHELSPSGWVTRFGTRIPASAQILDVACGAGRHSNWFADRGHRVHAVDREKSAKLSARIAFKHADIELNEWPFAGQQFDVVVVTNYLFRPLLKTFVESVAPNGWLIYETFAAGNEKFGRPSRPDFLLLPGELLDVVQGRLQVVAYEEGYVETPKTAMVQRIAARNATDHERGRYMEVLLG